MAQPQFTIETETLTANYGKFIIEPLPQGFGHTLGNSLRRVLYSSIPGAAITSITISGASHQFTSLEGVKEDIVQIILNLKLIRIGYSGTKAEHLTLSAKGAGPVTAGQFTGPSDIKIANPDLVVANLSDKTSRLEIEATVESGFGYSPADERKSSVVGVIPIDATFTPIVRVNYLVEATRVGRVTNFDKIILEITSDGTVSPELALKNAAQSLVEYFSAVVNPTSQSSSLGSSISTTSNQGSGISIEELDLPTRISNALQRAGFDTVAQLLSLPRAEMAKVKNLGGKSVKIIEIALKEHGFELAQ